MILPINTTAKGEYKSKYLITEGINPPIAVKEVNEIGTN
jgi:hypothetical protein